NFNQLIKIKHTAFHKKVDLTMSEADKQDYCRTYIVFPSTVYSITKTFLVDAGLQNSYLSQIPMLIKASVNRVGAGMVRKGLALKLHVYINDCQSL
ncbi:uncharacterized protein PHACADRAFT_59783, partial [Phanerochaete carnosa HHB-10118-sp]